MSLLGARVLFGGRALSPALSSPVWGEDGLAVCLVCLDGGIGTALLLGGQSLTLQSLPVGDCSLGDVSCRLLERGATLRLATAQGQGKEKREEKTIGEWEWKQRSAAYPGGIVSLAGGGVVGPVDLVQQLAPDALLVEDVADFVQHVFVGRDGRGRLVPAFWLGGFGGWQRAGHGGDSEVCRERPVLELRAQAMMESATVQVPSTSDHSSLGTAASASLTDTTPTSTPV